MNRGQFLASLLMLPMLRKLKPKPNPVIDSAEDIARFFKVPTAYYLQNYERDTFKNCGDPKEGQNDMNL